MAQRQTFHCDCCGECVNDCADSPIVVYIVAGHVNGGGEVDPATLPPLVAELLAQPTARREYCVACFARDVLGMSWPPAT